MITAHTGEYESIVNIRIASPQSYIRFNYPAITKFPVKKDEQFTLFSCFHNGSIIDSKGRVEVRVSDRDGAEVGKFSYEGIITSGMIAEKVDIISQKDYDYLKLHAQMYTADNKLVDEYEVEYDCKSLNICSEDAQGIMSAISTKMIGFAIALTLTIIAIGAIVLKYTKKK